MEIRPIRGEPNQSRDYRYSRFEKVPAPGCWVVNSVYPDSIVWGYYPHSGSNIHEISDFVLGSNSDPDLAYSERTKTVVLKRKFQREGVDGKSPRGCELVSNNNVILELPRQPNNDQDLYFWWGMVRSALLNVMPKQSE